MKKYGFIIILIVIFFILSNFSAAAKIVNPQETDELLKNPGKGWMSMFKAASQDSELPSDIPSTLYYVRINWEDVHIGPDQYSWARLDSAIADAQADGQQVMIRLMPVWGGGNSPLWMRDAGYNGYNCNVGGGKWSADLDDPNVQAHIDKLLQEMGKRYDDNPGVHSMEINFLGVYGEGHYYECPNIPMPTIETQIWLVNEHYLYFPHLPIIGPIHVQEEEQYTPIHMYRQYGQTRGAGIFFDCWGDATHMSSKYLSWLERITGQQNSDIWEKGIMKLEPCSLPSSDIPTSLQWALDIHATFIGNKDHSFPTSYKEHIKETLKKLGYRLVLRKLEHPDSVGAGENLNLQLEFENIGVAPPYRDYYLAVRLKQGSITEKIISDTSVKFWLPGTHNIELSVSVPSSLSSGSYDLAIGIVSPYTDEPILLMPIQGRESSGWHPLSTITIGQETTCTNNDNDGYGNPASTTCTHPELDCDDNNADINPGATEICGNGIDEDCNGQDLSCSLLGDLNNDGQVNLEDFIQLITRWLRTSNITNEDINNDNRVDTRDLGIMMSGWGQ